MRKFNFKFWFIKRKITDFIDFFRYSIPYGVKNLIRWFPVIWNDRNWDQWYIYKILHKKLSLMEKGLRNGYHLHADKTADQVKVCVLLLDRLIKDQYHDNAFKQHETRWGTADFNFEDIEDDSELCRLIINRPNVKTPEDEKAERKDFQRAFKHSDKLEEQDLDLLFKMIRKHIRGWWD